jgi:hypothetical protein
VGHGFKMRSGRRDYERATTFFEAKMTLNLFRGLY